MRLPRTAFALPAEAGMLAEPYDLPARVWQEHLMKHPFGVERAARGAPWDEEGFGTLGFSAALRAKTFAAIRRVYVERDTCTLPEVAFETPNLPERFPCKECPRSLARACEEKTAEAGQLYALLYEELLAAICGERAQLVSRATLTRSIVQGLVRPYALDGVVTGYVGVDERSRSNLVFRVSRADGLRAELYFDAPSGLRFRTLYRDPPKSRNAALTFLGEALPNKINMPLSEVALVSHPFWEAQP